MDLGSSDLRDEQNHLVTEMTGGSGSNADALSVTNDNVFLGSLLVASKSSTAWTYMVSDHLGSPRQFWNASGTAGENHRYWPYGEDANTTLNQHVAFQEMERNDGLPVYFDHARSQQFNLGRFTSTDVLAGTVSHPGSLNRYSLGLNNPLRYVDPDGGFPAAVAAGIVLGSGVIEGGWRVAQFSTAHPDASLGEYGREFTIGLVSGGAAAVVGLGALAGGARNPYIIGAAAAEADAIVAQRLEMLFGLRSALDLGDVAAKTLAGALVGKVADLQILRGRGGVPNLFRARPLSQLISSAHPNVVREFALGLHTANLGSIGFTAIDAVRGAGGGWVGGSEFLNHFFLDAWSVKGNGYTIGITSEWCIQRGASCTGFPR